MQINFATVLKRALTAGMAVGVLMGAYMYFVVEPTVDEAIEVEESLVASQPVEPGAEDDEPLFDRDEQTAGGVAANLTYAGVVSCIFGVVFARLRHRLPGATDLVRSVWLAAVSFGAVALMPAIKYPANPPAVGDPDTVDERTVQYLGVIVLSVVAAVGLFRVAKMMGQRMDRSTQIVAMTAITAVVYGLILVLLPGTPDTIAPEVPAALVWEFRIRSLGGLAILWAGLGLGLGWLLDRDTAAAIAAIDRRDLVRG